MLRVLDIMGIYYYFKVVSAAQAQVAKLSTTQGFVCNLLTQFVKQLVCTLPEELNAVYLCNSGTEANDLALRIARKYTGNKDVATVEGAYYGYLSALLDISPKLFPVLQNWEEPKDFVHVLPLPDMYRGRYSRNSKDSQLISVNSTTVGLNLVTTCNQLRLMHIRVN